MDTLSPVEYSFDFEPSVEHNLFSEVIETLDLYISFRDNANKFIVDHLSLLARDRGKIGPEGRLEIFLAQGGKATLEGWLNQGYEKQDSFIRRRVGPNCLGEFWWCITVIFRWW
jgi:hypothetical protein